mgnify:CR=1 FL=1
MFYLGSVSPDLEVSRGCGQHLLTTKKKYFIYQSSKSIDVIGFRRSEKPRATLINLLQSIPEERKFLNRLIKNTPLRTISLGSLWDRKISAVISFESMLKFFLCQDVIYQIIKG